MRIQVFPLQWQGQDRIGIRPLGYDPAFPDLMKSIAGSRWTADVGLWHIPYSPPAYKQLQQIFGIGQIEIKKLRPVVPKSRQINKKKDWSRLTYYAELLKAPSKSK